MADSSYQQEAEAAIKESNPGDFIYAGEKDLGHTWAITFSKTRDSGITEQSNYDAIKGDLEERFPKDVSDEHFRHFAVGWIDHLLVRMLDKNGKVTKAGIAVLEWKDRLKDYPIADDEDYSEREYRATIDNIKFEGSLDQETAKVVYDWFRDADQRALENIDDKGGYPSKEKIETALKALGLLEEDEERGPEKMAYVDPPEQLRFWPQ